MKMRVISLILVALMTGLVLASCCADQTYASTPSPFMQRFTREHLGNYMYVIVDKVTGVCYFAYLGNNCGGLCAMVDTDGTPLTYSEAWYQVFGEGTP